MKKRTQANQSETNQFIFTYVVVIIHNITTNLYLNLGMDIKYIKIYKKIYKIIKVVFL